MQRVRLLHQPQHVVVEVAYSDERQRCEPEGAMPTLTKAYDTDAGYDIPAWLPDGPMTIPPGERVAVPTGVRVNVPPGLAIRIIGRSSAGIKGFDVAESIIDAGYQGSIVFFVRNRTEEPLVVMPGQRLGQAIFFPVMDVVLQPVAVFEPTPRGENGLGSTGA